MQMQFMLLNAFVMHSHGNVELDNKETNIKTDRQTIIFATRDGLLLRQPDINLNRQTHDHLLRHPNKQTIIYSE